MNAMVQFKSNISGLNAPTPTQRTEVLKEMQSLYQARRKGLLQDYLKKVMESTGAKSLSIAKSAEAQSTSNNTGTTRTPSREISSDTFLKLLVMQMQYQDPLEPVQNTEMLAQLAQFSALEQSVKTNTNIASLQQEIQTLSQNVQLMSMSASQQMIGRYIEGSSTEGTSIKGKVDGVSIENGVVLFNVGSNKVPINQVQSVRIEPTNTK
ncbi:MAG TPA: flagellar hook capping FlgD N-terminal domain-containing protein [Candidatus Hydrogenedens sp.]|nr:flagellar hook capping FlgD N-terminal domain-containing protein [Candidatus Hydrogenedens sp.]